MFERCPACRGRKEVMGAGMIFHKCKTCLGVGHVEAKNNAEQDNVQNTENTQAKTDVDSCTPDSGKAKWQQDGEPAMGIGESHLPKRKRRRQGCQENGCDTSKEKQSSEQV